MPGGTLVFGAGGVPAGGVPGGTLVFGAGGVPAGGVLNLANQSFAAENPLAAACAPLTIPPIPVTANNAPTETANASNSFFNALTLSVISGTTLLYKTFVASNACSFNFCACLSLSLKFARFSVMASSAILP